MDVQIGLRTEVTRDRSDQGPKWPHTSIMHIPPLNIVRIIIPVVFRLLSVDVGVDTGFAWQRHDLSLQTLRRQPKYAYTIFTVSVMRTQASSVTTWRCSARH